MEATWWTRPEQLDNEQKAVIALPIAGNHMVLGPPGSGKTNLLLLRGAYLQASGKNEFRVLTFGRVLKEFLRSGTETTQVPPQKIKTYHGWALDVLGNCGIEIPEGKFSKQRLEIAQALNELTDDQVFEYRLDCILLDECQDYTVQEITAIARFADNLFAAGDNRQRIYQHAGAIELLRTLCPSVKTLTWHYRNGKKICRVADGIAGTLDKPDSLESLSQYVEADAPSSVRGWCLGRRLSRDVMDYDCILSPPTADVGIDELELLVEAGRGGWIKSDSTSGMNVELAPNICSRFFLPGGRLSNEREFVAQPDILKLRKIIDQAKRILDESSATGGSAPLEPQEDMFPDQATPALRYPRGRSKPRRF